MDRRVTANYADDFELLRVVAKRCVDIHPEDASGYYRLAAIYCVLGNERELHAALKTAVAKDKNLHWIGWITLGSWASIAIKTSGDDPVSVARALVYSWRAVACGDDQARESLRKDLEASDLHKRRELYKEPDTLGIKLLYELLPPNPAGAADHSQR